MPLSPPHPSYRKLSRRKVLLVSSSILLPACATQKRAHSPAPNTPKAPDSSSEAQSASSPPHRVSPGDSLDAFRSVEERAGGRLGVFALDTGSGATLSHRADERFAMASTFKWVLAALVLAKMDAGEFRGDERVGYEESDLLEYAPATRMNLAKGSMSVFELCEASVTLSDNTAANLLLTKVGGPASLTKFARSHGDEVTRLDRNEPTLNENAPGDVRDTTSPRAMVRLMERVLLGNVLEDASRALLLDWMKASETGKRRIVAGLPPAWETADKTGTGARGAVNDVAIIWPPGRAPLIVAVYTSDSSADFGTLEGAHADVARFVADTL